MQTIQIKISDSVYDKVLTFLQNFKKEELEIVNDDSVFLANKKYIQRELAENKTGKAKFYSEEAADQRLDDILAKY